MQAAQRANALVARPQKKMVGVGEDDLRAEFFELLLSDALDAPRRPHGHECGSVNRAVRRVQSAQTRAARIGLQHFERKRHRHLV